jgi:Uma2 family endonuclease
VLIIVEVLSGSTRRRDHLPTRDLYLDAGVAESWIVDAGRREVRVVRGDRGDSVVTGEVRWLPPGVETPLVLGLEEVFGASTP